MEFFHSLTSLSAINLADKLKKTDSLCADSIADCEFNSHMEQV